MEQVLEKRSNLVFPTTGYELDREKMSCVCGIFGKTTFNSYLRLDI